MRVDVVLYGGQNDGGEQVGQCVQRDILGLRDPNETAVPESALERAARERKERKEKQKTDAASERASEEKTVDELLASSSRAPLEPICEANSMEEAFGAAFDEGIAPATPTISVSKAPTEQPSAPSSTGSKSKQRAPRLKPLPPDLLIVAGTSLKVPGTKRIVREFAKACQARDKRYYSGDSEEEASESEEEMSGKRTTRARAKKDDSAEAREGKADDDDNDDDDDDDVNAPIRTILLNYDFPVPGSQWDGVFDAWVQGDVQQAALGLWEATKYPREASSTGFGMGPAEDEEEDHNDGLNCQELSWANHCAILEEERKAAKKRSRASPSASTRDGTATPTKSGKAAPSSVKPIPKGEAKVKSASDADKKTKSSVHDAVTKKAAASIKKSPAPQSKAKAPKATSTKTKTTSANPKKAVAAPQSRSVSSPKKGAKTPLTSYMKGTKASTMATVTAAPKKKVK